MNALLRPQQQVTVTLQSVEEFSQGLRAMGDYVGLDVINPLVLCALYVWRNFGRGGAEGIVGALESAVLRAAPNCKRPLMYVLDAITRQSPEYAELFARNLETVFSEGYREAEETVKPKILGMLKVWSDTGRFSELVIARTRARVGMDDPNYTGPALSDLPMLPRSSTPSPPPLVVAPPQVLPIAGGMNQTPSPAVWNRAQELLGLFLAQMGQAPASMSLSQVQVYSPDLFSKLMMQARDEVQVAWFPPSTTSYQAPPVVPSAASHFGPQQQNPLVKIEETDLSLARLTQRALLDVPLAEVIVAQLNSNILVRARPSRPPQRGFVEVRCWYITDSEWKLLFSPSLLLNSSLRAATKTVALFNNVALEHPASLIATTTSTQLPSSSVVGSGGVQTDTTNLTRKRKRDTPNQNDNDLDDDNNNNDDDENEDESDESRAHAVRKDDSQSACALTGEPFETFWSDEEQSWMYARAIRPNPHGPIYSYRAWKDHPHRVFLNNNPASSA